MHLADTQNSTHRQRQVLHRFVPVSPIVQALAPYAGLQCRAGCCAVIELVSRALLIGINSILNILKFWNMIVNRVKQRTLGTDLGCLSPRTEMVAILTFLRITAHNTVMIL